MRAGGGDRRHRREHLTQRGAVLLQAATQVRPPRVVEQGERQVSLEDLVGDLGRVEVHVHREGALLGWPVRPLRLLARLLQTADGGQRLGAGEQGQVEVARSDLTGGFARQRLGDRAADARVVPPARRCADPRGQPGHGVVVLPRLRVDDVDALERAEDGGRIGSAVRGGVTGHLLPHVERFGCAVRRVGLVPGVAGDADDAGGAGVGGHWSGAGQPRDLPGMAMARSAMMFFWISVEPPPMVE